MLHQSRLPNLSFWPRYGLVRGIVQLLHSRWCCHMTSQLTISVCGRTDGSSTATGWRWVWALLGGSSGGHPSNTVSQCHKMILW